MTFLEIAVVTIGCLVGTASPQACLPWQTISTPTVSAQVVVPVKTGQAVEVVLSAKAALVWDVQTGEVLYTKNDTVRRPIASLSKLLAVLAIRDAVSLDSQLEIPLEVTQAQRLGANIRLPVGEHATTRQLLEAGLVASANDALVTLAHGAAQSEDAFVVQANAYALQHGLRDTHLANSTGLSGGEQYSTAQDVKKLLTAVYDDPILRPWLAESKGVLTTTEGTQRAYLSTNKLLDTYLPILAAKTGFTTEAGENLAIITVGKAGQPLGAVILGSQDRFQDMKVLVEWIWRNYTWPAK